MEFGKLIDGKGEYTLTADSGWRVNLKDTEYFFDADWNTKDFEKELAKITPLSTKTIKLTNEQLSISFSSNITFTLDLDNLKNIKWSLNSKFIGGHLCTESGKFMMEKEG